ncbi:MAG: 30S ribosome-binding factor RbfA [Firmicutes bacterium]|nr:30S ribosome-binding factor RbfA [Bacillota bacterium]
MSVNRARRLAELVKEEMGQILHRMLKDPRIGFVSVTDVEVSTDLAHIKIYLSPYGDAEAKRQTMAGLESARGFIRSELGQRLRLRHTPEIELIADDSIERGARIMSLLEEIKKEQGERS